MSTVECKCGASTSLSDPESNGWTHVHVTTTHTFGDGGTAKRDFWLCPDHGTMEDINELDDDD